MKMNNSTTNTRLEKDRMDRVRAHHERYEQSYSYRTRTLAAAGCKKSQRIVKIWDRREANRAEMHSRLDDMVQEANRAEMH